MTQSMLSARPAHARVLIITGATATGKTDIVLDLARRLRVQIISADAAQVYRGMDIGTAKPDAATLTRFPHRLIDIRNPQETYSAAEFRYDALDVIEQALGANQVPLVTGGTMFYLSALVNGLSRLPRADDDVREEISSWARRCGWEALHEALFRIDAELAMRIKPQDRQRLQRAHEIHRVTARPPSEVMAESRPQPIAYPCLYVALFHPRRATLHERIEQRFDEMLQHGLVEEVAALRKNPLLLPDTPSLRTVGYRQAWEYLDGTISHAEFRSRAIAATRQLAKRQLTWLRQTPGIVWMNASHPDTLDNLLTYLNSRGLLHR